MRSLLASVVTLLKYALSACFATLLAFSALILVALGTETGRLQLGQIALAQLNAGDELQIHVDDLRLPSLAEWHLAELLVERDGQVLLHIENLSLHWRPLALFSQKLIVEQLQIERLRLNSSAPEQPATTAAPFNGLSMPSPLQFIGLERLIIGHLESAALPGTRLFGELLWRAGQPLQLVLNASTLEPYLGHPLSAAAKLELAEDLSLWRLDYLDLLIDSERGQHISGALQAGQLDFTVSLQRFPIDLLAQLPQVQTAHPAVAEFFSQGPHQTEVSATANIGGSLAVPSVKGEVKLEGHYNQSPLSLHLLAEGRADQLQIEKLEGQLMGANLSAKGALNGDGSAALALRVEHLVLERLRDLNVPLPDSLEGEIVLAEGQLHGPLSDPLGDLRLVGRGSYQQQQLSLEGRLRKTPGRMLIDNLQLTADLGIASLQGAIELDSLAADLQISLTDASLALLALAGTELPADLSGQVNAQLGLVGLLSKPTLRGELRVAGQYLAMPFNLHAKGTSDGQQSHLESLELRLFDKPTLELAGDYSAAQFDLSMQLNQLPAELLHAAGLELPEGHFQGLLRLSGSPQQPQLNGDLQFATQLPVLDDQGEEQLANWLWQLRVATEQQSLRLVSRFQRNNSTPGELILALPLQPYIGYLSQPTQGTDLPLALSLEGLLDLESLSFLIDQDIQRLQGRVQADLKLGGTLAEPMIEGYLELVGGAYKNHLSGTEVHEIGCRLGAAISAAQHVRLVVERCVGRDGSSGSYVVEGDVELPSQSNSGAINLSLHSQQANFIRRSDIESEVTGDLRLRGDFTQLKLSGALDLSPFTAVLGDSLSSAVPALKVEEVFAQADATQSAAAPFLLPAISVDLAISASQQAYLRGRGLEAELRGQIALKGDLEALQYEGQFKTVRGVFELFGKQFRLQKGQVSFANNSIAMDISGSYKKGAQQIDVGISGTPDDIDISLSAVPTLPEDEIIAFIIFGKSLDTISPIEALQLAAAVQSLRSGSSRTFDPIGSTRQLLGVDSLNIGSGAGANGETGLNLGVGKYLNEKVYLEVERTPNPSQPWKGNITIELAPNITLESSTGGEAGVGSAQLRWKRDY